jgi:hypothetical protein
MKPYQNHFILYTAHYQDGDNEYNEPVVVEISAPCSIDIDAEFLEDFAHQVELEFGTFDDGDVCWDENRIFAVHDPKRISPHERKTLARLGIA